MRSLTLLALLGCALVLSPPSTRGADWDAGMRGIILAGDAPPANDMPGAGLLVRRTWKDHWVFGAGLEQYSFDYEEPYNVVGIGLDPSFGEEAIDGTTDSTVVSAWIERRYNDAAAGGWSWFWTAGIGYAFISVDESITGPAAGGGTFDIVTQASDELHLLASGGARYSFGAWFIDAAIHAQHQFTDYDVMDRVSGATGEIGAQTLLGASLGLSYRF